MHSSHKHAPVVTKLSRRQSPSKPWCFTTLRAFRSTLRHAENIWKRTHSARPFASPSCLRTRRNNVTDMCRANLGGRVGNCPPNYNIGWAANVFCPPKKIFPTYIQSTELHSTNRKLRSTSTCRIESTHPPVESAHPMKKSFPRYCIYRSYTEKSTEEQ